MKLYDYPGAPSPRRVRMFLAEKGIEVPRSLVDLGRREQFDPAFRALNPRCVVPALSLDDGALITESSAICLYFELLHPEPPLMGRDAKDQALVAMWDRRMELEGFQAAAEAFRNFAPGLAHRALVGPHDYEQIPGLAERGAARMRNFHADLDARLAQSPFVAGDAFTIADITAFVTIDFAEKRAKIPPDFKLSNLARWRAEVAARPSAEA